MRARLRLRLRLSLSLGLSWGQGCEGVGNVEYFGVTYPTVAIGQQCWFAENLQTAHYRNGEPIQDGLSKRAWRKTRKGATSEVEPDDSWNPIVYGRHYNGYAVMDPRGLCPAGWRVPTEEDWAVLEAAITPTLRSPSDMAEALKTPRFSGNNSSGFAATAAGLSASDTGEAAYRNVAAFWWTSTREGDELRYRHLYENFSYLNASSTLPGVGMSIRCVRE